MHALFSHPHSAGLMVYDKIRVDWAHPEGHISDDVSHAALNASLNGISGILLAGGYAAIRAGKREVHKYFMFPPSASPRFFWLPI